MTNDKVSANDHSSFDGPAGPSHHEAGIFDIRSVIGLLLGVYGVILLGMGIFADPQFEKTGNVNANLIAGIALLVIGIGFEVWAKLSPTIVDEQD